MANTKEVAMLFDASHCTGCRGCQVACKEWNVLPAPLGMNANKFTGSYQSPMDLNGNTRLIMTFDEKPSGNTFHPIDWAIGRRSCYHCTDAGCVSACSSGALSKNENGVVEYDTDKCNGCTFCQAACPFDVPRFRPTDGRIDKCTLCMDRIEEGGKPACVHACQPEALFFGPREEMLKKAHERVAFLKKKGFDKAEVYGETECGGLHVIQVCQLGHEAYGLPTDPKPKEVLNTIGLVKPITAVGAAAVVGALAVSFLANLGYRRKEVTLEEAKASWTPEQRALAEAESEAVRKAQKAGKAR